MMTDLMPFNYEGRPVRTVTVNGAPWFVAADVCAVLDIRDTSMAVRSLDDDERGTSTIGTPSGEQNMLVINEPGLFSLILRSRKPEAKAFKRWVTHEVLPAIRREGGYISPAATGDQLTLLAARAEVQTRVLRNLDGIVDRDWLEAKARHVAARALGEEPEIDPDRRPLTVGEYLAERGIPAVVVRQMSSKFGKRLKAAFIRRTGHAPMTVERFVDGALRQVAGYTERDRPLFDERRPAHRRTHPSRAPPLPRRPGRRPRLPTPRHPTTAVHPLPVRQATACPITPTCNRAGSLSHRLRTTDVPMISIYLLAEISQLLPVCGPYGSG